MKINLINNDRKDIIRTADNSFDDNYILPSLRTLLEKLAKLEKSEEVKKSEEVEKTKPEYDENITIYLVSKNSGNTTQLKKGNYKYIEIKFIGNEYNKYKEIKYYKYENNILKFADKNKLCFFEIGAFLDLFNILKSLENKNIGSFLIYELINNIINKNKLIYLKKYYGQNNKTIEEYKGINYDEIELIIKERELKRLKKILQEYYDYSDNSKAGILPSYRLEKHSDASKKSTRYYTLESLIILDEILRIYKNIKEDSFYFIRNISYLEDTNDIKDELFDKRKVLKALKNTNFIKSKLYIENILDVLDYNNSDKEFKSRIENIKNSELKKLFDSEDIENINNLNNIDERKNYIEDYIFILFNNIKIMIDEYKDIKDDDKKTELENKIIDYDLHFFYFKFVLDYMFLYKKELDVYNDLYDLYRYKYFYLKKDNIDFFESIYKKHDLINYKYPFNFYISIYEDYIYKNYDDENIEDKYKLILKEKEDFIILSEDNYDYLYLYYDFVFFLLYYTIINNEHVIERFKRGSFKSEYTKDNLRVLDYYSILATDELLNGVKNNIKKIKILLDIIYFSNIKKESIKNLRDDIINLNKKTYYIDNIINDYDITDTLEYLKKDEYINKNKEIEKIESINFPFNKYECRKYFDENISRIMKIYNYKSRTDETFRLFFNFAVYEFNIDKTNFEMIYKHIDKILFSIEKVNKLCSYNNFILSCK